MSKGDALFISFDDCFLSYAICCINSILSNYPDYPSLIIDYQGNNKSLIDKLKNIERSTIVRLSHDHKFRLGPVGKDIVFNRYALWGGEFDSFNSILHLDADTIVLDSLDYIFDGNKFYAVEDPRRNSHVFLHKDKFLRKKEFSYSIGQFEERIRRNNLESFLEGGRMINAGVFMLPQECRSTSSYESIIGLASLYDEYVAYADQSIISIWSWVNGLDISNEFQSNCQIWMLCDKNISVDFQSVKVLHLSGESKYYKKLALGPREFMIYDLCNKLRLFYRKSRSTDESKSHLATMVSRLD